MAKTESDKARLDRFRKWVEGITCFSVEEYRSGVGQEYTREEAKRDVKEFIGAGIIYARNNWACPEHGANIKTVPVGEKIGDMTAVHCHLCDFDIEGEDTHNLTGINATVDYAPLHG